MRKRTVLVILSTIFILSFMLPSALAQDYGAPQGWFGGSSNTAASGGVMTGIWGMLKSLFGPLVEINLNDEISMKLLLGFLLFALIGVLISRIMNNNRISWVIAAVLSLIVVIATPGKVVVAIAQTYAFAFAAIALGAVLLVFFMLHKQLKRIMNPEEHPRGYHLVAALYYAVLIVVYQSFFGIITGLITAQATQYWFLEVKSFIGLVLMVMFLYHLIRALFTGIGGKGLWPPRFPPKIPPAPKPIIPPLTPPGPTPPGPGPTPPGPGPTPPGPGPTPPGPGPTPPGPTPPRPPTPTRPPLPTAPTGPAPTMPRLPSETPALPPGPGVKGLLPAKGETFGAIPNVTGAEGEEVRAETVLEEEEAGAAFQEERIAQLMESIDARDLGNLQNLNVLVANLTKVIETINESGVNTNETEYLQDAFNGHVKRIMAQLDLNQAERDRLMQSLQGLSGRIGTWSSNELTVKLQLDKQMDADMREALLKQKLGEGDADRFGKLKEVMKAKDAIINDAWGRYGKACKQYEERSLNMLRKMGSAETDFKRNLENLEAWLIRFGDYTKQGIAQGGKDKMAGAKDALKKVTAAAKTLYNDLYMLAKEEKFYAEFVRGLGEGKLAQEKLNRERIIPLVNEAQTLLNRYAEGVDTAGGKR